MFWYCRLAKLQTAPGMDIKASQMNISCSSGVGTKTMVCPTMFSRALESCLHLVGSSRMASSFAPLLQLYAITIVASLNPVPWLLDPSWETKTSPLLGLKTSDAFAPVIRSAAARMISFSTTSLLTVALGRDVVYLGRCFGVPRTEPLSADLRRDSLMLIQRCRLVSRCQNPSSDCTLIAVLKGCSNTGLCLNLLFRCLSSDLILIADNSLAI